MNWNDALEDAKMLMGYSPHEYVDNLEVRDIAKSIMSTHYRRKHAGYMYTESWKWVKEQVLIRDNHICQDCKADKIVEKIKEIFLLKGFDVKNMEYPQPAKQVHHISYNNVIELNSECHKGFEFLFKTMEIDDCISLCDICHNLRHCTDLATRKKLREQRKYNIYYHFYIRLLNTPEFVKMAEEQSKDYIQSLTTKPSEWDGH